MTNDQRKASTELRTQTEQSVWKLFEMCRPVVWADWDAQTHGRRVAMLDATRDRIVATIADLVTVEDFNSWIRRWTPALGQVARSYVSGYPADAYQVCARCGGTMEPQGDVSWDEGDGSASVGTRCTGTCGVQSSFDWTAGELEYLLTFGHAFDETNPAKTGEIRTAEQWCTALDSERQDHGWTLTEQVAHAQAGLSAAGVPLTGVMAKTSGGQWPEAVLTTAAWVVGWDRVASVWRPLSHPDGGT